MICPEILIVHVVIEKDAVSNWTEPLIGVIVIGSYI
jgi:hypothetical protein